MNEIFNYIDYLKTISTKEIYTMGGGEQFFARADTIHMSYPIYEKKFLGFIDIAWKYFNVRNYQEVITIAYPNLYKRRMFDSKERFLKRYKLAIKKADMHVLSAIFTKELRAERFCDGHWIYCYESGIFLSLVERLAQITI